MLKLLMALRQGAHEVEIIHVDGQAAPELGTSHPEEEDRRAAVVRAWGHDRQAPRSEHLATIDMPLPQRTQTILSHEVDADIAARLNGAPGPTPGSRHANHEHTPVRVARSGLGEE